MTPEELAHLRRARDLMDREYAKPLDMPAMANAALLSLVARSALEGFREFASEVRDVDDRACFACARRRHLRDNRVGSSATTLRVKKYHLLPPTP